MKILSSFDTRFKQKKLFSCREKYGSDKVLIISKSFPFLVTKVIFPFFFLSVCMVGILLLIFSQLEKDYVLITLPFMIVLYFLANISVIKYFIDYTMDFCIVTPEEVILIRQEGLLRRTEITLETTKVKSIYVSKVTFWDSLFNEGIVDFMGEGDERSGEISFDYVHHPEKVKDKIQSIILTPYHG